MGISRKEALRMVGPGWERLINKLYEKLPKGGQVSDVKEKYGTLRFYVFNCDENYLDFISSVEDESAHICEQCGKSGNVAPVFGWYLCLCEECRQKRIEDRGLIK